MKFKVGDKVRVTNVSSAFKKIYVGNEVIIKSVNPNGNLSPLGTHYGVEHSCFVFAEKELAPVDNHKIVITTDGKETLARLYDGNKVVKSAVAKCSPEDEFCFETGAKLAFDRLTSEDKQTEFKIGERYKYHNSEFNGIIEITRKEKRGDRVYFAYKIIEGMYGDSGYPFWSESGFAKHLTHIDKPKYYNGKVVCVETPYTDAFTVGKIYTVSDGVLRYDDGDIACKNKTSFKDIQKCFTSKFVEVVE